MKIEKLKPGMIVYDVGSHKMGNTTISTISVWSVLIRDVDILTEKVTASWNGNKEREYNKKVWSKWRISKPQLIKMPLGNYRLARRGEITSVPSNVDPEF